LTLNAATFIAWCSDNIRQPVLEYCGSSSRRVFDLCGK